jgi:hypothetical protein
MQPQSTMILVVTALEMTKSNKVCAIITQIRNRPNGKAVRMQPGLTRGMSPAIGDRYLCQYREEWLVQGKGAPYLILRQGKLILIEPEIQVKRYAEAFASWHARPGRMVTNYDAIYTSVPNSKEAALGIIE